MKQNISLVEFLGHIPAEESYAKKVQTPSEEQDERYPFQVHLSAFNDDEITDDSLSFYSSPSSQSFFHNIDDDNHFSSVDEDWVGASLSSDSTELSSLTSDSDTRFDDALLNDSLTDDLPMLVNPCTGLMESSRGSGIDVGGNIMFVCSDTMDEPISSSSCMDDIYDAHSSFDDDFSSMPEDTFSSSIDDSWDTTFHDF